MKIEFEMPDSWDEGPMTICCMEKPMAAGSLYVYERGDSWIKIRGCEDCYGEGKELCCRGMPHANFQGVSLHLTKITSSNNPFQCGAK